MEVNLGSLLDSYFNLGLSVKTKSKWRSYLSSNPLYRSEITNKINLKTVLKSYLDTYILQTKKQTITKMNCVNCGYPRFTQFCVPEHIYTEETIVLWPQTIIRSQFTSNKSSKREIKLFKLCLIHGYTYARGYHLQRD